MRCFGGRCGGTGELEVTVIGAFVGIYAGWFGETSMNGCNICAENMRVMVLAVIQEQLVYLVWLLFILSQRNEEQTNRPTHAYLCRRTA